MSLSLRSFIMAVLKFIGWYVFKEEFNIQREARINKINKEYVDKIEKEMYKDE